MVKHIVMWTLKDIDRQSRLSTFRGMLEAMQDKVDGLIELQVGFDESKGASSCDMVLYSVFESWAALDAYLNHPDHLAIKQTVASWIDHRHLVDYEVHPLSVFKGQSYI